MVLDSGVVNVTVKDFQIHHKEDNDDNHIINVPMFRDTTQTTIMLLIFNLCVFVILIVSQDKEYVTLVIQHTFT